MHIYPSGQFSFGYRGQELLELGYSSGAYPGQLSLLSGCAC